MKLTIERKALVGVLGQVVGVLPARAALPVLSYVSIGAGFRKLAVRGTDLEVTAQAEAATDISEDGSVCVPGKKLFDLVRAFADEPLTLATAAEGKDRTLTVTQGRARVRLSGLDSGEFPISAPVEEKARFEVVAGVLREAVDRVKCAVVIDESRPSLSGIRFVVAGGVMTAVATDTRRLPIYTAALPNATGEAAFTLPLKAAGLLKSLWPGEGSVSVVCGDKVAVFAGGGASLTCQLIDGAFPDYTRVIPADDTLVRVELPRAEFTAALRRAAQIVRAGKNVVTVQFAPGQVVLTGETSGVGDVREEVATAYNGEPLEVVFNPDYLLDGVAGITGEQFVFAVNRNAEKPSVLSATEGRDYRYLVMPMRV